MLSLAHLPSDDIPAAFDEVKKEFLVEAKVVVQWLEDNYHKRVQIRHRNIRNLL